MAGTMQRADQAVRWLAVKSTEKQVVVPLERRVAYGKAYRSLMIQMLGNQWNNGHSVQ